LKINKSGAAVTAALALSAATLASGLASGQAAAQSAYREQYRPQYHFTPAYNWMNDPNGLLYYDGSYNLFFQWDPNGTTWGDISWGHASGPDLLHWQQQAPAILASPEELIFSGSAVADTFNTSGLGSIDNPPLVAVYTSAYNGTTTLPNGQFVLGGQQAQSLAYSLDGGLTWTRYAGNPVILLPPSPYQPQYNNFRDPNVFWYAPGRKWVMIAALSALHKVVLFSSPDLKTWSFMSTFGPANATGGNWECPDLFQLPVDGDAANKKWVLMLGVNPGAVAGGSGTQYFLGQFDGNTFTPDPGSVLDPNQPAGSTVIANFEAPSYAAIGWTATGGLAGAAPTYGSVEGQQTVTGFKGKQLLDTFIGADATQGTLTSPAFRITKPFLNLLVGGGYHPYNPATYGTAQDTETAVDLLVGGKVVRTVTGTNSEHLGWRGWDVGEYLGRWAQVQVVDANSGGWGHLNVDQIVLSDTLQQEANWVDFGPDFYAANSWNGLPADLRVAIGWMNNWNYGGNIPTSPWRSAMSIPRHFTLQTLNGQVKLIQQPVTQFAKLLETPLYSSASPQTLLPGTSTAAVGGAKGDTLAITAVFKNVNATEFGFKLRKGNGGQETLVGYDPNAHELFLDRWNSGDISFDPSFPGRYIAPLEPDAQGNVTLQILVDWSSVEVFANGGQVALTAQVFPAQSSSGVAAYSRGGNAVLESVTIQPVRSVWHH
jgi:beta-fructofuranosidase/levanase